MRVDGAHDNLTPADLREARETLGTMWQIGRRVSVSEMAVMLGFHRRDAYLRYEGHGGEPTGPMSTAVRAMLAGYRPDNAPAVDLLREQFIVDMSKTLDVAPSRVRIAVQNLEARGLIARQPSE